MVRTTQNFDLLHKLYTSRKCVPKWNRRIHGKTGTMMTKQCFLGFHVTKPVVSCQGQCVVVGCTSGRVQVWDCSSGENMSTAQAIEKVVAEWKIVACCLDMYSEKYIL